MSGNDLAKAAAEAGRALEEGIRTHKRSQEAHRRAARKGRIAIAQLKEECERNGIELILESDTHTKTQGGPSNDDGATS